MIPFVVVVTSSSSSTTVFTRSVDVTSSSSSHRFEHPRARPDRSIDYDAPVEYARAPIAVIVVVAHMGANAVVRPNRKSADRADMMIVSRVVVSRLRRSSSRSSCVTSVDRSIDRSVIRSIDRSVVHSVDRSVVQSIAIGGSIAMGRRVIRAHYKV